MALCMMTAGVAQAEPAPLAAYMEQPVVKPDARIAYGSEPAQVVELFLPKGKGPHPVVVLLHGGCWQAAFEGLPQTSGIAADLAKRGLAVWNVEYRRHGEPGAGYPGTFQDVAAAVDRLRAEAFRYDLDLGRVVASGHSAGGHLALWAASRHRLAKTSPLWSADPLPIRTVISLAGVGDLKAQEQALPLACGESSIRDLVGQPGRADPFADTSPGELLPSGVKAVMIHGAYDHVLPPYSGLAYANRARAAGDKAEVVTIPDAGHFDVVIPTTSAWAMVAARIEAEVKALK
ncbi:MAG: alpha/beta hydrolase [Phenylobacterium sp.]